MLRRTTTTHQAFADPNALITAVRSCRHRLPYRPDVLDGCLTGIRLAPPPRHHGFKARMRHGPHVGPQLCRLGGIYSSMSTCFPGVLIAVILNALLNLGCLLPRMI